MAWSDIASSDAFQLAYPIINSLLAASSPAGARAAYGLNAGMNVANYYGQQQQQKERERKLGEFITSAEKFAPPPQIEGAKPLGSTFTPEEIARTSMLQRTPEPAEPAYMMGAAPITGPPGQPDIALSNVAPPPISPNIAAPKKQPVLTPEQQRLAQLLPYEEAYKLIASQVQPKPEAQHVVHDAKTGGISVVTTGPEQARIQNLTAGTPPIPTRGDELFVQAAKQKFPDDMAAQAAEVQRLRNNPQGYMNRVFADALEKSKTPENPQGDVNIAMQAIQEEAKKLSQGRATGTGQGQMAVRSTPEYKALEQELARLKGFGGATGTAAGTPLPAAAAKEVGGLESALRQMDIVEQNLNDEFLGPVKGTETAYSVRSQIGTRIGSPISDQEANFRGALATAKDQLFRAKEGGVIPDAMYRRLEALVPNPKEEPQKFRTDLKRFTTELRKAMETTTRLGTTPRGQPGGSQTPTPSKPSGIPKVISIEKIP